MAARTVDVASARALAPPSDANARGRAGLLLCLAIGLAACATNLWPPEPDAAPAPADEAVVEIDAATPPDMAYAPDFSTGIDLLQPTFSNPVAASAGMQPQALAVGDLDGDGAPDVVVGSDFETQGGVPTALGVLLNDGHGKLGAPVAYGTHLERNAALADVTGDGKIDIVTTGLTNVAGGTTIGPNTTTNLAVLVGKGDGSFAPSIYETQVVGPIAVSDLDGDGFVDVLAITHCPTSGTCYGGGVQVLLNDGTRTGNFKPAATYPWTAGPLDEILVADFDGDGKTDFACGFTLFQNLGGGTFVAHDFGAPCDTCSGAAATGDLDGDGLPDLVVTSLGDVNGGRLDVYRNLGGMGFDAPASYLIAAAPVSVALGDLNLDGHLDCAIASYNDDLVSVLAGRGDGGFGAPVEHPAGAVPAAIALGDFNRDGKLDIAVANRTTTVSILFNTTP